MRKDKLTFNKTLPTYGLVIVDTDRKLFYLEGGEEFDGFVWIPEFFCKKNEDLTAAFVKFCEKLGLSLDAYQQLDFPRQELEYSYMDDTPGLIKEYIPYLLRVSPINSKSEKSLYPLNELSNLEIEEKPLLEKAKRILGWN